MNFGFSTRLDYDRCAYNDRLQESTAPIQYRLNADTIRNRNACLTTLGPRASYKGVGVSTAPTTTAAPSQDLVDVESLLSNRGIPASKCKSGRVNNIDVRKHQVNHVGECNSKLNPEYSRLNISTQAFREVAVSRFVDLPRNPQAVIYWDNAANTQLEARDNHKEKRVVPRDQTNLV